MSPSYPGWLTSVLRSSPSVYQLLPLLRLCPKGLSRRKTLPPIPEQTEKSQPLTCPFKASACACHSLPLPLRSCQLLLSVVLSSRSLLSPGSDYPQLLKTKLCREVLLLTERYYLYFCFSRWMFVVLEEFVFKLNLFSKTI